MEPKLLEVFKRPTQSHPYRIVLWFEDGSERCLEAKSEIQASFLVGHMKESIGFPKDLVESSEVYADFLFEIQYPYLYIGKFLETACF